jgi:hypothetical protein
MLERRSSLLGRRLITPARHAVDQQHAAITLDHVGDVDLRGDVRAALAGEQLDDGARVLVAVHQAHHARAAGAVQGLDHYVLVLGHELADTLGLARDQRVRPQLGEGLRVELLVGVGGASAGR